MITERGYSKDPSIMPEGIVITWSEDLIESKGGMKRFCERFEINMQSENDLWLNKCQRPPKYDILFVYIIVAGKLKYRCYYGGFSNETKASNDSLTGRSWCNYQIILWPHIILAGPFETCPFDRELKGFQGFRYCTKLF